MSVDPTVTGDRSCAIVVIAVSFRDWLVDGTRAGWTDSTVMGLVTGSYQVTFVRLACPW